MRIDVRIHEREVLAAGVLVLGPTDRDMSFNLDDMEYVVRLFPGGAPTDPFQINFLGREQKHLTIEIHGPFPEFTAAWKLTAIGRATGRRIDLDLMVFSQSRDPDCVRQVGFTFTATRVDDLLDSSPEAGR